MNGRAYYNEFDAFAAAWLRELIAARLVPAGDVDERDIRDVSPRDLDGYTACHFFAGIGGWAYALQLADWPDDRPVWTGSCPCQPFSAAGRGGGFADERHLWPAFFHLIRECRPASVFGEQVASKPGLAWLDLVRSDLEGEGYAVGAADLCAAGVGAPHIRQRLFWVADADAAGLGEQWRGRLLDGERAPQRHDLDGRSALHGMGDAGRERRRQVGADAGGRGEGSGAQGLAERPLHERARGLGDAAGERQREARPAVVRPGAADVPAGAGHWSLVDAAGEQVGLSRRARQPGSTHWSDLEWLPCRDGKARPAQPGIQPLAHGIPNRVGTLRGAGNAIVGPLGAVFIETYESVRAPS